MFKSTHDLVFEVAPYKSIAEADFIQLYRVGTCEGQWFDSNFAYHILSIRNTCPGNGHLDDVFEWFEQSCRRDCKAFMIMDFFNERFKIHCIMKRGFAPVPNSDHVVKIFS
jgi:hypothetical protein